MKKFILSTAALCGLAVIASAQTATMTAKSTFRGDGWFKPGEDGVTFLGTGNNERGLAVNPLTGNVILVSRNGGINVQVLDKNSGAVINTLNSAVADGVTGGTFAGNMIGAGADGKIYMANLSTSLTSAFKIYQWDSEAPGVAPTVAFNANSGLLRTGDSFDVYGSGAGTTFVASGSGSAGYAYISGGTATVKNPAGTATGDFRLGMTFMGGGTTVLGNQGGSTTSSVLCDIALNTKLGNPALSTSSARILDYTEFNGWKLLAAQDTISGAVQVYSVMNPLAPVLLATGNLTTSPTANGNGTGSIKWGQGSGTSISLYGMSSNMGIQAFNVNVVPEPGSFLAMAAGAALLAARRRRNA